ncbi:Dihydroorotate dehydrogenase [Geoalkalibacter ferrihydriticus]|nr:4Fe-4S dicluster-binding protein [Geoalkalibacter ferrihydriticus]SDL74614.1 Dihydroorotate dehydrogenase [Geoalkalibacter ferrihydriticus]
MLGFCAINTIPSFFGFDLHTLMASGGISSGFDAVEFMLLGAPLVQVGTEVMLRGFGLVDRMQQELREFMGWHGFTTPADFIGRCRDKATSFEKLLSTNDSRPHLLAERCTSCGLCHIACRDGGYPAISWNGGLPEIDHAACTCCSLCSHVCPTGAIFMNFATE